MVFLNPLVIIELTGNLHFEGLMLTFFGFGILLFLDNKKLFAVFPLALSVGTKLITIIIIPFIINHKKISENLKVIILFFGLMFFIFFYQLVVIIYLTFIIPLNYGFPILNSMEVYTI